MAQNDTNTNQLSCVCSCVCMGVRLCLGFDSKKGVSPACVESSYRSDSKKCNTTTKTYTTDKELIEGTTMNPVNSLWEHILNVQQLTKIGTIRRFLVLTLTLAIRVSMGKGLWCCCMKRLYQSQQEKQSTTGASERTRTKSELRQHFYQTVVEIFMEFQPHSQANAEKLWIRLEFECFSLLGTKSNQLGESGGGGGYISLSIVFHCCHPIIGRNFSRLVPSRYLHISKL